MSGVTRVDGGFQLFDIAFEHWVDDLQAAKQGGERATSEASAKLKVVLESLRSAEEQACHAEDAVEAAAQESAEAAASAEAAEAKAQAMAAELRAAKAQYVAVGSQLQEQKVKVAKQIKSAEAETTSYKEKLAVTQRDLRAAKAEAEEASRKASNAASAGAAAASKRLADAQAASDERLAAANERAREEKEAALVALATAKDADLAASKLCAERALASEKAIAQAQVDEARSLARAQLAATKLEAAQKLASAESAREREQSIAASELAAARDLLATARKSAKAELTAAASDARREAQAKIEACRAEASAQLAAFKEASKEQESQAAACRAEQLAACREEALVHLVPCRVAAAEAVQRAHVAEEMLHLEHLEREAAARAAHARAVTKFTGELSVAMRTSGAELRGLEQQLAATERARAREVAEAAASAQRQARLIDSLREELTAARFACSNAEKQHASQQQLLQKQLEGQRRYLQEHASIWGERGEVVRKLKEKDDSVLQERQRALQERQLATDLCVGYAKVAAESQAAAAAAELAAKEAIKEAYEDVRLGHSERAMLRLVRNGEAACSQAQAQLKYNTSAVHVPLGRASALAQKVAIARARHGAQ